jgi:hypothetical protein
MNGGFSQPHADAHAAPLRAVCIRAHAPDPTSALQGRPNARDLVRVTQALIDAGELRVPSNATDEQIAVAIKKMQWEWGIGVDCTNYVLPAALRLAGKAESSVHFVVLSGKEKKPVTLPCAGCDYFQSAESNPHLERVKIADARTGDVLCLDDPKRGAGHRALVYSHDVLDASKTAALASKYGPDLAAFATPGPVHMIEVDSSWGAGEEGGTYGGTRRDTLFFNETTGQWAQLNARVEAPDKPFFEVTKVGPSDERLHGIYRFR